MSISLFFNSIIGGGALALRWRRGKARRRVGGCDGKRRGNSPPREGLQLCVAPYFADRGVGDMRGAAVGVYIIATPEVVAGCHPLSGGGADK